MGTLHNPNPPPSNPNSTPTPNPTPAVAVAAPAPPSFDDVSKLFSLSLSDAADSLGVCPSVLKQVCYDNGLVRWPYRKFLAGKSIDDIKKDAAIEKEKKLAALNVAGAKDSLGVSAVPPSLSCRAPQTQRTSTGLLQESQASKILVQQPTKTNQSYSPQNAVSSITNKGSLSAIDEFRYGFPSAGLSSVSLRWWGNKDDTDNHGRSVGEDSKESKHESNGSADTDAALDSSSDAKASEGKESETDGTTRLADLLTRLRKKAGEETRQAFSLGVYKGYDAKALDRAKKKVLLQIFQSSLPSEWGCNISSKG